MGKRNKLGYSQSDIFGYLTTDYPIEENEIPVSTEVQRMLNVMVDNRDAIKIEDIFDPKYGDVSHYCVGSEFMIKHDKKLKKSLVPEDYSKSNKVLGSRFIDEPDEIVQLKKNMLLPGCYFIKFGDEEDTTYAVFIVSVSSGEQVRNSDGYIVHRSAAGLNVESSALYFIGPRKMKYFKKYFKLFNKYKDISRKSEIECIHDRSANEPFAETQFKSFDKLVFKEKKKLIEYVDHFIDNIPRYYNYGMIPKLSILLYGGVGCGKTSCTQAIAKHLGLKGMQCINADYFAPQENGRRKYIRNEIITMDDIDCICNSRDDDDSMENKAIMKQLLSFLDNPPSFYFKAKDGIYYPISIVVATTNYYDKLDPAVRRYGRFDLQLHMSDFDKDDAEELCNKYGLTLEDIVPDYKDMENFSMSPAHVDALCMANIDKKLKDTKEKEDRNNGNDDVEHIRNEYDGRISGRYRGDSYSGNSKGKTQKQKEGQKRKKKVKK